MIKKPFAFLLLIAGLEAKDLNYGGLCDSLKLYKKECALIEGHAGHLWEHTVWVTKAMMRLFDTDSKWIADIDKKYEYLMVVSAFIHDVGKAGDLDFLYTCKPDHPMTGVKYLLNKQPFYKDITKEKFNFQEWFVENEISQEDQKILIVLAGMHQEFGVMMSRMRKNPEQHGVAFGMFLERFIGYCRQVDYNGGYPDELIIRMAIALTVADVQGLFPVSYPVKYFPELHDEPQSLFNVTFYFDPTFIDTKAYAIAQELIIYCRDRLSSVFATLEIIKNLKQT